MPNHGCALDQAVGEEDFNSIQPQNLHLPEVPCFFNSRSTEKFPPLPSARPSISPKLYARDDSKCSVSREVKLGRTFYINKKQTHKLENFLDLDNNVTFYRNANERLERNKKKKKKKKTAPSIAGQDVGDFASKLCDQNEAVLKQALFNNFYSPFLDENHLRTKCVDCLKHLEVFTEVKVTSKKNAADSKMLAEMVKRHYSVDIDTGFNIISGDRGFEVIRPELYCRKVQHLSFHARHDHNDISLKAILDGPRENDRNVKRTSLGNNMSALLASNIKKVYFVYSETGSLSDYIKYCLDHPDSAMLVFRMKDNGITEMDREWEREFGDRFHIYETDKEKKGDAPWFLLEFAALALHYEAADVYPSKSIEFEIVAKELNQFVEEVQNYCIGRTVTFCPDLALGIEKMSGLQI